MARANPAHHRPAPYSMLNVAALEKAVLANFADRLACRRKHRRAPPAEARAESDGIGRHHHPLEGEQVVTDFARYAAAIRPMRARRHGGQAR